MLANHYPGNDKSSTWMNPECGRPVFEFIGQWGTSQQALHTISLGTLQRTLLHITEVRPERRKGNLHNQMFRVNL